MGHLRAAIAGDLPHGRFSERQLRDQQRDDDVHEWHEDVDKHHASFDASADSSVDASYESSSGNTDPSYDANADSSYDASVEASADSNGYACADSRCR